MCYTQPNSVGAVQRLVVLKTHMFKLHLHPPRLVGYFNCATLETHILVSITVSTLNALILYVIIAG